MFFRGKSKDNILKVMDISGTIRASVNKFNKEYQHFNIINELIDAKEDENIKGVLLRVNSPGGTAGASMELAMTIEELVNEKPVVAHITDMACSGALMASVACSKIVANPMSTIGSIGVIMMIPNLKEVSDKLGIKMNIIKSAPMKDIGNPFREMTEEEQNYLKKTIEDSHKIFMDYVENKRHTGKIREIADGKFFNANDALELKLVDELGSLNYSMELLRGLANLESEEIEWKYSKSNEGIISRILESLTVGFSNSIKTEMEQFFNIHY